MSLLNLNRDNIQNATLYYLETYSTMQHQYFLNSFYIQEATINDFTYYPQPLIPPAVSNIPTPNIDTLYFRTILNLDYGPVTINIPEPILNQNDTLKYYSLQIIDSNALNIYTISPRTNTDPKTGGLKYNKYIFRYNNRINNVDPLPFSTRIPPITQPVVNKNVINCNCKYVLVLGRVQVDALDSADLSATQQYFENFTVEGCTDKYPRIPFTVFVDPKMTLIDPYIYYTLYEQIQNGQKETNRFTLSKYNQYDRQELYIGLRLGQKIIQEAIANLGSASSSSIATGSSNTNSNSCSKSKSKYTKTVVDNIVSWFRFPYHPEGPGFFYRPGTFEPPEEYQPPIPPENPLELPETQPVEPPPFQYEGGTAQDIVDYIDDFKLRDILNFKPTRNQKVNEIYDQCLKKLVLKDVVAWQFIYQQDKAEALYIFLPLDSEGQPLNSANCYEMSFKSQPANNAFWSLTVYDNEGYFVENSLDSYGLNSVRIQEEPGQPFKIYLSTIANKPADPLPPATYWIATPEPAQNWNMCLRVYLPQGDFKPPQVKKITNCPIVL